VTSVSLTTVICDFGNSIEGKNKKASHRRLAFAGLRVCELNAVELLAYYEW
jgi:hypothetical protein